MNRLKMLVVGVLSLFAVVPMALAQGDAAAVPDPMLIPGCPKSGGVSICKEVIEREEGAPVTLYYMPAYSHAQLMRVADSLEVESYPLVVLRAPVFVSGMAAVRNLLIQRGLYQKRDDEWALLDSLQTAKMAKLQEIIAMQELRVENYANANHQLMEQMQFMSDELDASLELTRKSLRGRQARNLYIGILGGAVGFSVASLIAIVK